MLSFKDGKGPRMSWSPWRWSRPACDVCHAEGCNYLVRVRVRNKIILDNDTFLASSTNRGNFSSSRKWGKGVSRTNPRLVILSLGVDARLTGRIPFSPPTGFSSCSFKNGCSAFLRKNPSCLEDTIFQRYYCWPSSACIWATLVKPRPLGHPR